MIPCCSRPYYVRAWLPRWPFAARHCQCCGITIRDMDPLLDLIWLVFVAPFCGPAKIERDKPTEQIIN